MAIFARPIALVRSTGRLCIGSSAAAHADAATDSAVPDAPPSGDEAVATYRNGSNEATARLVIDKSAAQYSHLPQKATFFYKVSQ